MDIDKEKELFGQKFRLVDQGLDEGQVYAFVNGLTDQLLDTDFSRKLKHLDSIVNKLTKQYGELANRLEDLNSEPMPVEEEVEQESPGGKIRSGLAEWLSDYRGGERAEVDKQGSGSGGEVSSIAGNPGPNPVPSSPQLSDFVAGPRRRQASNTDDRLEHLDVLTRFAERTVIEAVKEAESVKVEIEQKAKAEAVDMVQHARELAKGEADSIITEAGVGAERKAQEIISVAEQRAREIVEAAEKQTGKKKKPAPETAAPVSEQEGQGGASQDVAGEVEERTAVTGEEQEGQLTAEDGQSTLDPDSYAGTVELSLPPPISLNRLLQVHKQLKEHPSVHVLSLSGSVDQGIIMKVLLETPIPLLKIIEELPEVENAEEEMQPIDPAFPGLLMGPEHPLRKIIVNIGA